MIIQVYTHFGKLLRRWESVTAVAVVASIQHRLNQERMSNEKNQVI